MERRDAERAIREKNGETLTTLRVTALGDPVNGLTEYGEVMQSFDNAIGSLDSRITAIDQAVDFHNGVVDALGSVTGGTYASHRISRIQFDDEDPKYQIYLRNGARAQNLRDELVVSLLTAGAGRVFTAGGRAIKLLSASAKTLPNTTRGWRVGDPINN